METMKLTDQQSVRIAELPEEYRVVGIDRTAPLVRKPTGQILRIQPNGRLIAATIAAKQRLADRRGETEVGLPDAPVYATPYTGVLD
jgi:hypothetical protein